MDAHALSVLEYDKILAIVAGHARSEPGRALVSSLLPAAERTVVEARLGEAREGMALLRHGEHLPLEDTKDLSRPLGILAAAGSTLPAADLLGIASTLAAGRRVRQFFEREKQRAAAPRYPLLGAVAARIRPLPDIESAITGAIDEAGEVRDGASQDLRRIRKQIRRVREELLDRLQAILRHADTCKVLHDPLITQRDGRYVLPLKPNFRQAVRGVVHGQSASRASVFVEPLEVLEQNNRLAELRIEERDEVERILRSLTAAVGRAAPSIRQTQQALAELDAVCARARYGIETGGAVPAISDLHRITLRQARHPLLVHQRRGNGLDDVVANDIELDEDRQALIISGPNAGGKTVVLKTVGLLCAMAQAGIPVTASADSAVPVLNSLFAAIGDEQSIEARLSTFSAHAAILARILAQAREGSLVLLDEPAAGTDPEEGGALAAAVLEELLRRRCFVVVTTHHGALKIFGSRTGGAVNAAMEFDPQTLAPTYRLLPGRPGRSYGLEMALRLGVPPAIVEGARSRLSPAESRLDDLLEQMEQDTRLAAEYRRDAEAERTRAQQARREAELRLAAAEDEARAVVRRTSDEARALVLRLRRRLRELSETSRLEASAIKEASRELEDVANRLSLADEAHQHPARDLVVGRTVRIPRLNAAGKVTALGRGSVAIDAGGKMLTVPANEVVPVEDTAGGTEPAGPGWSVNVPEHEGFPDRVSILGKRVDEAAADVEHALNRAALLGRSSLAIIHGIGTGALKQAVAELLKQHPLVAAVRPAQPSEGGAGVTVAELRN